MLNKHVQNTDAGFISYYRGNPDTNSNTTDSIVSKVHQDLWRFFLQILIKEKKHTESMMQKQASPVHELHTLILPSCYTVHYKKLESEQQRMLTKELPMLFGLSL